MCCRYSLESPAYWQHHNSRIPWLLFNKILPTSIMNDSPGTFTITAAQAVFITVSLAYSVLGLIASFDCCFMYNVPVTNIIYWGASVDSWVVHQLGSTKPMIGKIICNDSNQQLWSCYSPCGMDSFTSPFRAWETHFGGGGERVPKRKGSCKWWKSRCSWKCQNVMVFISLAKVSVKCMEQNPVITRNVYYNNYNPETET